MRESGLKPNSHSGKALKHILETLPRDELFQSSQDELLKLATGILGPQERVRSKLFLRRDRYRRLYSAPVYLPRDRYKPDFRLPVEALLTRSLQHTQAYTNTQCDDTPLARCRMLVPPGGGTAVKLDH